MASAARPAATTRLLIPPFDAPPPEAAGTRHAFYGETMGTSWSVQFYGPPDAAPIRARIEAALGGVIAEMSNWSPDSFLSRFNAAAPGTWHDAPAGFRCVLAEALRVAALTGGAFNPAAGALTDLWGFGPQWRIGAPDTQTVAAAARAAKAWRTLVIAGGRVLQPGVALDFSGIAKGYAVDRVAACLAEAGAASFLVEIGGELSGRGVKDDASPWWVELEAEPAACAGRLVIALHGVAVASSGGYRRRRRFGGRDLTHTIDTRSGRPLDAAAAPSVSVVHPSCMTADALATALGVMGAEEGLAFAARHGIAARIVAGAADGHAERLSPALAAMLA